MKLDDRALEAAAISSWNEDSMRATGKPRNVLWSEVSVKEQEKWRGMSRASITTYFTALEADGLARHGLGYQDTDGGEAWDATTGGFAEPGGFPITIIRERP